MDFSSVPAATAAAGTGVRFITAASDGDLSAVKAYLKDGLDVNSQDWDKLTALIAAASQGHLKVVKLLLDKVGHLGHLFHLFYRLDHVPKYFAVQSGSGKV